MRARVAQAVRARSAAVAVAGWSILLLEPLIVAIETRSYPVEPDTAPPTTGSLLWWLLPIALAALAAGIIGGAVVVAGALLARAIVASVTHARR